MDVGVAMARLLAIIGNDMRHQIQAIIAMLPRSMLAIPRRVIAIASTVMTGDIAITVGAVASLDSDGASKLKRCHWVTLGLLATSERSTNRRASSSVYAIQDGCFWFVRRKTA